jgi:hypothetical protein
MNVPRQCLDAIEQLELLALQIEERHPLPSELLVQPRMDGSDVQFRPQVDRVVGLGPECVIPAPASPGFRKSLPST